MFKPKKYIIVKNSKEENKFVNNLIKTIQRINMENVPNKEFLEHIMNYFADYIERIWNKHLILLNTLRYGRTMTVIGI